MSPGPHGGAPSIDEPAVHAAARQADAGSGRVAPSLRERGTIAFVAAQLGNAVFSVLGVVAIAVSYHDLRLAREGVDTAALARVFE